MFDSLLQQLNTNQFLSGGLVLGILTSVVMMIRRIPFQIYSIIRRQYTIKVECSQYHGGFEWLVVWFDKYSDCIKYNTRLIFKPKNEFSETKKTETLLFPGMGRHYFKYKKSWFIADHVLEDSKADKNSFAIRNEKFTITTARWNKNKLLNLMLEAHDIYFNVDNTKIAVHSKLGYGNTNKALINKRPIESVFIPESQKIIQDIQWFFDNEQYYRNLHIPYRRNYLFSGVSGSGKSTLIMALASYFSKDIYYTFLSSFTGSGSAIKELFADIPENTFIVFEDIDVVKPFKSRKQKTTNDDNINITSTDDGKVTLSLLLNCFDGIIADDNGRIIFMTTNYAEDIDSAYLRPGRVDCHIKFHYATVEQTTQMIQWFHPDEINIKNIAEEYLSKKGNISMAEVQGDLIQAQTIENFKLNLHL